MVASDVASDCRAPRSRAGDRARGARGAGSVAAASPDDSVGEEPLPRRGDWRDSRSAVSVAVRAWSAVLVLAPIAAPALAGALLGASLAARGSRRRRGAAPARALTPMGVAAGAGQTPGERRYIASQGEIVHERPWPDDVEYVPMTAQGDRGARLPLGEGQHVFECGGTGTGKTTTARRLLAARTLAHGAAALLIDQKGDPEDEEQLRRIAAAAGRPFVLFDPRDPEHRSLAAVVGRAGGRRRAGGRADQELRALLRRRAAPAPEPDRRSAARRGPLAAELPVARRRRPRKPLRDDLRSRRRTRRRAPAAASAASRSTPNGSARATARRTSPAGWCGSSW